MPRISVPTRDEAPAESQPILDSVGKQLGFIPNGTKITKSLSRDSFA